MARPTKLNAETQERIITAIRAGNYIETAAAYAGINKTTLYDWMKRGEREKQRVAKDARLKIRKAEQPFVEFSNAVQRALAEAEVRDVAIIAKAAEEQWQAAAWRLERKFPEKWGKRQIEIEHKGQVEVRHDVARRIIEDEQATDLAHKLLERLAENDPGSDGVSYEPGEMATS